MYLYTMPKFKSDRAITFVKGEKMKTKITIRDDVAININKSLQKLAVPDYERLEFITKIKTIPKLERLNPEIVALTYVGVKTIKKTPDEDLRNIRNLDDRLKELFENTEYNVELFATFFNYDEVTKNIVGFQQNMLRYIKYLMKYIKI
jgi:hypothetical protein